MKRIPEFRIELDKKNNRLTLRYITPQAMKRINSSIIIARYDDENYKEIQLQGGLLLTTLFALAKDYLEYVPESEEK
jgi:hypothetical protein